MLVRNSLYRSDSNIFSRGLVVRAPVMSKARFVARTKATSSGAARRVSAVAGEAPYSTAENMSKDARDKKSAMLRRFVSVTSRPATREMSRQASAMAGRYVAHCT